MDLKKINFRQPKYIFPLVVAVPFGCLLYLLVDIFSGFGGDNQEPQQTDFINTDLPEPDLESPRSKLREMNDRYDFDDAFGAVDGIGREDESKETLDDGSEYTEEELDRIMRETEEQRLQREQLEEAQRRILEAQRFSRSVTSRNQYDPYEDIDRQQAEHNKKLQAILNEPDLEEKQRAEQERLAREQRERMAMEEPTSEVIKADNLVHQKFNTVASSGSDAIDTPLIKAMIDQTTKSTDGTRLRFKLLDDVIIQDVKIKKGSFIYGNVVGFGQQRVKVNISSILVGDRFMKVSLNVYDLDGMEGFYVPESSFREFMKNAASSVAGQNIQLADNSGMTTGFDAENVALQTIQNIYQSLSSAVSNNLRKNKAKIKYNTIVYLINSK